MITHGFLFLPTLSFIPYSLTSNHTFCGKSTLKGYKWYLFCLTFTYLKSPSPRAPLTLYFFLNIFSNFKEMGKARIWESSKSRLNNYRSIPPGSLFCLSLPPIPGLYGLMVSASLALRQVTQLSLVPQSVKQQEWHPALRDWDVVIFAQHQCLAHAGCLLIVMSHISLWLTCFFFFDGSCPSPSSYPPTTSAHSLHSLL